LRLLNIQEQSLTRRALGVQNADVALSGLQSISAPQEMDDSDVGRISEAHPACPLELCAEPIESIKGGRLSANLRLVAKG
jgi:hypothetical protein